MNKEITLSDYPGGFVVTGRTVSGQRFKKTYDNSYAGGMYAFAINLFNGSVWGIKADGHRTLLKRVVN